MWAPNIRRQATFACYWHCVPFWVSLKTEGIFAVSLGLTFVLSTNAVIISTYFRYSQVQYYLSNVLPLRSTQTPQSYNRNNNNNNKPEKEAKYSHDHAHQINFLYNVNFQSMLIGYGVAVGVLMIGSFRMGEYFFHHLTGCSLGVFGGGVSMIYQIALIHLLNKQQVDHRLERSPRLLTILALVAMTSLALLSLFALILMYEVGFYNFVDMNFRHRWSPEVEGYELHACSALLEWIALACLSMGCIDMGWRMRRFGREFPGWLQARKEKLVRISSVSMACRDPEVYSISNVWNLWTLKHSFLRKRNYGWLLPVESGIFLGCGCFTQFQLFMVIW